MPMTLEEYRPLLERDEKAVRVAVMTYADKHPALGIHKMINDKTTLPLENTSKLYLNIRALLKENIPKFREDKNSPYMFLKDSWQVRKLECEYLRLRLIQANFTGMDNDLLSAVCFINNSSPDARWWFGDSLQYYFKKNLLDQQTTYYKAVPDPLAPMSVPARILPSDVISQQNSIIMAANRFEHLIQLSFEPARIEADLVLAIEGTKEGQQDESLDLKIELSKAVRRESPDKIAKDLAMAFAKRVAAADEKASLDCMRFVQDKREEEKADKEKMREVLAELAELKQKMDDRDKKIDQLERFMTGKPIGPSVPVCYPRGARVQLSLQTEKGDLNPNSMYSVSRRTSTDSTEVPEAFGMLLNPGQRTPI